MKFLSMKRRSTNFFSRRGSVLVSGRQSDDAGREGAREQGAGVGQVDAGQQKAGTDVMIFKTVFAENFSEKIAVFDSKQS
jgi:hypothetical protein